VDLERSEVLKKIQEVLLEKLGKAVEVVSEEDRFEKDLGLDSLDVIDLVMFVEDVYGIRIEDEEIENLSRVRDLVDLTLRKLEEMESEEPESG